MAVTGGAEEEEPSTSVPDAAGGVDGVEGDDDVPPSESSNNEPDKQKCDDNSKDVLNEGDDDDDEEKESSAEPPSMTLSLFICWILPTMLLAIFSRRLANTEIGTIPIDPAPTSRPAHHKKPSAQPHVHHQRQQQIHHPNQPSPQPRKEKELPLFPSSWPTSYREIIQDIHKRRRPIEGFPGAISSEVDGLKKTTTATTATTAKATSHTADKAKPNRRGTTGAVNSNDPMRMQIQERIDSMLTDYRQNPEDVFKAIAAADAMRFYEIQFHEGGTYELPAIDLYKEIIEKILKRRNAAIDAGETTFKPTVAVSDEVTLPYEEKSLDAVLCAVYTALGKTYFMANMFERAVQAYDGCLKDISPYYLDARNSRGSSLIVLGKYKEAGSDFLDVIRRDDQRLFLDAISGLARDLEAKEESVPDGWNTITTVLDGFIPVLERQITNTVEPQHRETIAGALTRLYHVLFTYHDVKTKDYPTAFEHLKHAYQHKMSVRHPWEVGSETAKVANTKAIFTKGFWDNPMGSPTRTPIFIIGFVRSGSTLLERILDAHPLIAGTGENSVFNGRLNDIRNQIVEASTRGGSLSELTRRLGNEVVEEMHRRWELVEANMESDEPTHEKPQRLADKMLTNYYNVGFIQMLYPNALILHVAREPMDTIFSAYKHEFPPGALDYTSDFTGLAELYHSYRDVMDHWDDVLPGRVTHVRYKDMVQDFEGTARAIIAATGLPWDDKVLEFHKKKHAVNTLSTTQVRKGIYKHSLNAWKRYEEELQPLSDLIGHRVKYDLRTTLPGYVPKVDSET